MKGDKCKPSVAIYVHLDFMRQRTYPVDCRLKLASKSKVSEISRVQKHVAVWDWERPSMGIAYTDKTSPRVGRSWWETLRVIFKVDNRRRGLDASRRER